MNINLYTEPAQRRWMWAQHPDVAKAMESKEITPNMAVDIINARGGEPTNFSVVDFMHNKRPSSSFIDKQGSVSGQGLSSFINNSLAKYL